MKTFEDNTIHWIIALSVAAIQNGIAILAVYSSSQNRISAAACLGGYFGGLLNMAIIAVVVIWSIILAVKSYRDETWHPGLKHLSVVAISSVTALVIGMNAALMCTV